MADRPILFSAPMVRALLAGRKTQTRRVIEPCSAGAMKDGDIIVHWPHPDHPGSAVARQCERFRPRHRVGDRLYVREHWKTHAAYDDLSPRQMGGEESIQYQADGAHQTWGYPATNKIGRFRQCMHMPRWASRLTLLVTDVRVQRLQDCSEADALAEGYDPLDAGPNTFPTDWYADLWDSINGAGSWAANPWVVAISFTVHQVNIDAMEVAHAS